MSEGISQNKPSVWLDITQLMKDATQEMEVGQLIQRENFGLFEAMSAIEIMDPKMDSGMNSEAVHTLEERLAMGTIPIDSSLSVQHLLGVMDKLLVCEAMWFTGNTLAQTLLTCLYLHNITLLKNPYLSLYCRLMLKTDEIIRLSVIKADVHDVFILNSSILLQKEEDFTAHTFGLALGDNSSELEVAKAMKEMEEDLISKIKKSKGELNDPNIKPLQEDAKKEEIYCEAMLARLRFRKNFYLANLSFDKQQCKGLEQASKYLTSCKSLLEVVKSSVKLGEVPEGVFDPAICRRLQSPTPIRVIPFISIEEAISVFSKIFSQFEDITSLTKYSTIQSLLKFFISFVSTGASILPRARLMNLFYSRSAKLVFGTTPLSDLVIASMKSFAVPNRYLSHITESHLLDKITTAFTETFRILCLNRARQRRKIPRHFDDWKVIQDEVLFQLSNTYNTKGSEVDENFSQTQSQDLPKARYLSCWILDQIVQLMTHYLQLGFDLDLYYDEDFPMLYWYLDYLFGVQYQNQMYVKQLEIDIHQLQKAGKKKKTQKKNKPNKKVKNAVPGVEQHLVEANIALCRGIFRLIFAVLTLKNLQLPSFPLGADDLRFYHRFACFHKLSQPGPLHFNHYKENTDVTNVKPEQLFSLATDSLKQSKTSIEKILHSPEISPSQQQELRTLAKVCISNLVQIQLISSQSNGKSISYDFNVHSKYPVVSIKS